MTAIRRDIVRVCEEFGHSESTPDQFMLGLLRVTWEKQLSLADDTLVRLLIVLYADWSSGELRDEAFRRRVRLLMRDE